MKKLFSLLFLAVGLSAQVTVTVTVAGETPATVTFSNDFAASVPLWISTITTSLGSTGLGADCSPADTTVTIKGLPGDLAVGNGLLFSDTPEIMLVTGVNPLVVARGQLTTTAAAHSAGTTVIVLRSGSITQFLVNSLADIAKAVFASFPSSAVVTQKQALDQAVVDQVTQAVSGAVPVDQVPPIAKPITPITPITPVVIAK